MVDPAVNEVSWQSAFWALVAIALNSMTQPCGKIYGFSEEYGFFLRSSPLICAYDAISTCILFGVHLWEEKSFRKASRAVISHRFQRSDEEIDSGSLRELQNNGRLRLFLFGAGVLPQLIKIYAFAGVPWTKLWASLYLVSFGLFEIVVVSQKKPADPLQSRTPGWRNKKQIHLYEGPMFVFHGTIFVAYMSSCVAMSLEPVGTLPEPVAFLTLILVIFMTFFMTLCVIFIIHTSGDGEESRDAFQALFVVFIQTSFLLFGNPNLLESHRLLKLLCFNCSHLILLVISDTSKRFWTWLQWKHSSTISKVYIVLLNFLFGLVCYSQLYDSAGTVKPKWTENLG